MIQRVYCPPRIGARGGLLAPRKRAGRRKRRGEDSSSLLRTGLGWRLVAAFGRKSGTPGRPRSSRSSRSNLLCTSSFSAWQPSPGATQRARTPCKHLLAPFDARSPSKPTRSLSRCVLVLGFPLTQSHFPPFPVRICSPPLIVAMCAPLSQVGGSSFAVSIQLFKDLPLLWGFESILEARWPRFNYPWKRCRSDVQVWGPCFLLRRLGIGRPRQCPSLPLR